MRRRQFNRWLLALASQAALLLSPLGRWTRRALAEVRKRILPHDTDLSNLLYENPAELDTRHLKITPLQQFGTMGLTDHRQKLAHWHLEVRGAVAEPFELDYAQLKTLPAIERKVLLICPGVFAFHARWKGVSIMELLRRAGVDERITHIDVRGPAGRYEKLQRFPMRSVRSDAAFLAYEVNGRQLPTQHGFPLRVVAEGYMGADWVKYVYRIEAVIAASGQAPAPVRSPNIYVP